MPVLGSPCHSATLWLATADFQPYPNSLSVTGQGSLLSVLDCLLQPSGQPLLGWAAELQLIGGQGTSQVAIGQGTFLTIDTPKSAPHLLVVESVAPICASFRRSSPQFGQSSAGWLDLLSLAPLEFNQVPTKTW